MSAAKTRSIAAGVPVRDALDGAVTALSASGCESPRLDAELLLAHALGVGRGRLLIDDLEVAGPAVRVFQNFVRRRAALREPVAYILGRRHFRRLELAVDPRALIPRPETELLVEVGLGLPHGVRVLDVGAGSGAVALALKDERPDLRVSGSDASDDALALARENAERLGVDVAFLHGDLLDGLVGVVGQGAGPDEFDAVLSNPPYVRDDERSSLAPEILRHEPARALFAGEDGLDVIRRLVKQAGERDHVRLLAVEVGQGQAGTVGELIREEGFAAVRAERDLAGIERVVVGERSR